jgi:hypothetical protein
MVRKPEGRTPAGIRGSKLENAEMDLKELGVICCGPDSSGSGESPVADCCKHGNYNSGSVEGKEFVEPLRDCYQERIFFHRVH